MNSTFKKNSFLSLFHSFRPFFREEFHTYRTLLNRNYYDVLNLKKECSSKEIKDSFIDLAKKYHPDANLGDKSSHSRFVELQRAYSVLSSPSKRRDYDLSQSNHHNYHEGGTVIRKWRYTDDSKDYEREYSAEYREYVRRSGQNTEPNPPSQAGALRITLLLIAFTTVGALVQYLVLKQDNEQIVPKPSHVAHPDTHSDRPFFIRWIYRRNYLQEMERHNRANAAFHALKQEMDNRAEEYDIVKLRAAYFKEVNGLIGYHLVPKLIRPELPPNWRSEQQGSHFDKNRLPDERSSSQEQQTSPVKV